MVQVFALRLFPDQDLKQELQNFVTTQGLSAGFVLSGIGSLKQAQLRLANQTTPTLFPGTYEILSLAGTLASSGIHLHMAIADSEGQVVGGHLVQGCLIYTTAEIVIGNALELQFHRVPDAQTSYLELSVTQNNQIQ